MMSFEAVLMLSPWPGSAGVSLPLTDELTNRIQVRLQDVRDAVITVTIGRQYFGRLGNLFCRSRCMEHRAGSKFGCGAHTAPRLIGGRNFEPNCRALLMRRWQSARYLRAQRAAFAVTASFRLILEISMTLFKFVSLVGK
jgi:hypothetical protein